MSEVKAKVSGGDPYTVEYPLPNNIGEATKSYGEEVVFGRFKSAIIIDLQGFMRSHIKTGETNGDAREKITKDLQAAVNGWKPGVRAPGKSPAEKVKDEFAKLDPDAKKKLLALLSK